MLELTSRSTLPDTQSAVPLSPRSAFGAATSADKKVVFEAPGLAIVEEPFLSIVSVRQSRVRPNPTAVSAAAAGWQLTPPETPNSLSGTAQRGCAWIEPNAWLLTTDECRAQPLATDGVIATDISDRFTAFRLTGACARSVIAAGCDPVVLSAGRHARVRFAGIVTLIIHQWGDQDFRLLVDVTVAHTFAAWLKLAALSVASDAHE